MILNAEQGVPSVASVIEALSVFSPDAPCRVGTLDVGGAIADVRGWAIDAVDCDLDPAGRTTGVWLTVRPTDADPPGAEWTCPTCRTRRYVRDGDHVPWCCT
jgi:hypothetical protein